MLEGAGHEVWAVELPGHGEDRTAIGNVTLDTYVGRVSSVLEALADPAILVGHSMGGGVITQTAEYYPDNIQMLVYLAGLIPPDGYSMREMLAGDRESLLLENIKQTEDGLSLTIGEDAVAELFYGDCSSDDIARAKARIVPQAVAPVISAIEITSGNFGLIPKTYIQTLLDNAISPALQEMMYNSVPCERVITMETSHSPFFSAPEELVNHLCKL